MPGKISLDETMRGKQTALAAADQLNTNTAKTTHTSQSRICKYIYMATNIYDILMILMQSKHGAAQEK